MDKPLQMHKGLHVVISSMEISQLKGLKDCSISFGRRLTAIMGVNGVGKSTVIHALTSCFRPVDEKEPRKYRFPVFFPKSPNGEWKNTKFFLNCKIVNHNDEEMEDGARRIEYGKVDRWVPKYSRQLPRDTYYIGIDSSVPVIEDERKDKVVFNTQELTDDTSKKITELAAYILNKDYKSLTMNIGERVRLRGVKTNANLSYSALSMGAGEQRLFSILETILNAKKFSLVLIDEIDLLMHPIALEKLVHVMNDVAKDRKLQIIFTTHSPVMKRLLDIVEIRFIDCLSDKTVVYDGITSPAWNELTGDSPKPIKVFVEDDLAAAHVIKAAKNLKMLSKVHICLMGSIENAFTLASAMAIQDDDFSNTIIVTDGDEYTDPDKKKSDQKKLEQINRHLTGCSKDIPEKREKALSFITELHLPAGKHPEEYLHSILLQCDDNESEVIQYAKKINAVGEKHQWINGIIDHFDVSLKESITSEIVEVCSTKMEWVDLVRPIYEWLQERQNI